MTHTPVTRFIAKWQDARARLAELERAEHPDLTDHLGRVWTWKGRGDLYVHDGNAVPADFVTDGRIGIPSQRVLDNPNYDELCAVCLDGRERNITPCRPEWNCSHRLCHG